MLDKAQWTNTLPFAQAVLQPGQAVQTLNDRMKRINKINLEIADWLQVRSNSRGTPGDGKWRDLEADVDQLSPVGAPSRRRAICAGHAQAGPVPSPQCAVRAGVSRRNLVNASILEAGRRMPSLTNMFVQCFPGSVVPNHRVRRTQRTVPPAVRRSPRQ